MAGSHGHSLLLLMTAPWCEECVAVEREMRSAAAQLTLLHRAAKLVVVDVGTPGGAAVGDALFEQPVPRKLPALLVVSGVGVWQYTGPTVASDLVRQMGRWLIGQETALTHADSTSAYRAVGQLHPAHLRGGTPLVEPAGSHVLSLSAANLSSALGDGSPGRPHAPLALLLLYGSESSTDWAANARRLHRAFRSAARLLYARGLAGCMFKSFVASGVRVTHRGSPAVAGSEGQGNAIDYDITVNEASEAGLGSAEWDMALRSILTPSEEPQRLLTAAQQSLPRILLLRHGKAQIWSSAVQHALDFVDVLSHLTPPAHATPPVTSSTSASGGVGRASEAVLLQLSAHNFSSASANIPLLFVAYTTRWCARCVELTHQLQRATKLLRRLSPPLPVVLATVDVSDPRNREWLLDEIAVYSFPVGYLYHHGVPIMQYRGGPRADNIAQELLHHAVTLNKLHKEFEKEVGYSTGHSRGSKSSSGGGDNGGATAASTADVTAYEYVASAFLAQSGDPASEGFAARLRANSEGRRRLGRATRGFE